MKYFFLLPDLAAGGAERVSITIARLLIKNGFDVEFLNLGIAKGDMESWLVPEFKLTSFGYSRVLKALPKLKAFMKDHPDATFFSSREHTNLVGLLAAKLAHRRMIVRIPNMPNNILEHGLTGLKMQVVKAINKWIFPTASVVIAQNKEMRKQLLSYYSLPEDKVVAINNPVDKDYVLKSADGSKNPFNDGEKVFLAACTIDYRKGIDVLIDAWPKVKEQVRNAHLYIIGRDSSVYAEEMKKNASDCNDISFLGFQANPYPYLKHCDVLVLSSRMEGFPNVVLEAMCFNKPVASTTCVDVINEIIQSGVNGYTCGIEDSEALANVMIKASQLKNIHNQYNLFDQQELINCFQ
jgi:Glycosyltransferase